MPFVYVFPSDSHVGTYSVCLYKGGFCAWLASIFYLGGIAWGLDESGKRGRGGGGDLLNLVSKLFYFQDVGAQSERLRTRLPALPGELPVPPSAHPLTAAPGRRSSVAPGCRSVATVAALRQLRCSCLRLCKKVREELDGGGVKGTWGWGKGKSSPSKKSY
jgi:hypothetical protein